ncbi:MAG TPA: hypothetical protein VLL95_00815, partial [Phnomibacter sp.]|nr:hypothetical protein [Phnomibacter sp.]
MPPVSMPNTEDDVHVAMLQGWKENKDYLLSQKEGEALAAHYRYLYSLPQMKAFFDPMLMAGFEFPNWQQWHAAYFSKGYLLIITTEPYAEPDIFIRFAKVFDQTYTRFLDLQRAEAQAREARIEAALEKVRSRTMAMQKSGDLNSAAADMFKEIQALGMQPWGCGFNIFDSDEKAVTQYMSLADGGISPPFRTPLTEDPFFIEIYNARQRKDELLVMESAGESLAETYRYMFGLPDSGEIFGDLENAGFEMPKYQITHCAYFSQGYLVFITYQQVTEAHDIFKRFAKVFDQTYTRFLDLQKAEAQAREAQIEAALERVRSRSMAMHDSKELGEVAKVMFNQMKLLGGELFAFGIVLCDKDENVVEQWHGLGEGDMMTPFQVPVDLDYIHRYRYDQWKAGVELFSIEIPSDYIARHFELMFALPSVKLVMDDLKSKGIELAHPSWEIDYSASFRYGYFLVSSLQPYAEEKIFPRFAKVFEQAYTRFLDLQKAEA